MPPGQGEMLKTTSLNRRELEGNGEPRGLSRAESRCCLRGPSGLSIALTLHRPLGEEGARQAGAERGGARLSALGKEGPRRALRAQ